MEPWNKTLIEAIFSVLVGGLIALSAFLIRFQVRFSELERRVQHMHERHGHSIERIREASEELLQMHHNPDQTGFGTRNLERSLERMISLLKDIRHYLLVTAEHQRGAAIPPHVEEDP